jgi:Mrp family chromosome partitioning ATPase
MDRVQRVAKESNVIAIVIAVGGGGKSSTRARAAAKIAVLKMF